MKGGWVKLYRKVLYNDDLRQHHSALILFVYLLLDNTDGVWRGGRRQLANLTGLSESSVYRALKKLKKLQIANSKANSKFTEIHICKWSNYQAQANSKANTLYRINKEDIYKEKEINKEKENTIRRYTGLKLISEIMRDKGVK